MRRQHWILSALLVGVTSAQLQGAALAVEPKPTRVDFETAPNQPLSLVVRGEKADHSPALSAAYSVRELTDADLDRPVAVEVIDVTLYWVKKPPDVRVPATELRFTTPRTERMQHVHVTCAPGLRVEIEGRPGDPVKAKARAPPR